jgi:uncharacterized protein
MPPLDFGVDFGGGGLDVVTFGLGGGGGGGGGGAAWVTGAVVWTGAGVVGWDAAWVVVAVVWVTVEVLGFVWVLVGFGFVATVVGVVGMLLVVAAELLLLEEEPQAAMTRAVVTVASEAMAVVRRFLISLKKTPPRAITSRPPLGADTIYSRHVHFTELTAQEQRVLGCLIEKRWTTPDQYPLSLNGLRLACNQTTNRDPVVDYDEITIRDAAERLSRYGLARLASGHGSRATKYRHLADEALGLGREELAVLAVLLLRGPQTPGELKGRTERMAQLSTLEEVERVVEELEDRGYALRLERRPGQKEERFAHLLGDTGAPAPPIALPAQATAPRAVAVTDGDLVARVSALEGAVAALRSELAALRGTDPRD